MHLAVLKNHLYYLATTKTDQLIVYCEVELLPLSRDSHSLTQTLILFMICHVWPVHTKTQPRTFQTETGSTYNTSVYVARD